MGYSHGVAQGWTRLNSARAGLENRHGDPVRGEGMGRTGRLGSTRAPAMCKTAGQWDPALKHGELSWVLCGSQRSAVGHGSGSQAEDRAGM